MLTNEQMKANRFFTWHQSRQLEAKIKNAVAAGRQVVIATYTRAWQFDKPEHLESLKFTRTGAYIRRGRDWDKILGNVSIHVY